MTDRPTDRAPRPRRQPAPRSSRCATSASPFGGVHAVDDVTDRPVSRARSSACVGDNGAGKSTLMKILSGAHRPTPARSTSTASRSTIANPRDAKAYGIETIYQTLALADNIDAPANMFLGRELMTRSGTLDDVGMEDATRKVMGRLNPNFKRFKHAGGVAVRRPAPVGGDRPRDPLQRPDPDHGRADRRPRPGRDGAGPRTSSGS